jgi:hypothetical protein
MSKFIPFLTMLLIGTSQASELTCQQHTAHIVKKEDRIEYLKLCDKTYYKQHNNKPIEPEWDGMIKQIAQDIATFNSCMDTKETENKGKAVDDMDKKYERHDRALNNCANIAVK